MLEICRIIMRTNHKEFFVFWIGKGEDGEVFSKNKVLFALF